MVCMMTQPGSRLKLELAAIAPFGRTRMWVREHGQKEPDQGLPGYSTLTRKLSVKFGEPDPPDPAKMPLGVTRTWVTAAS